MTSSFNLLADALIECAEEFERYLTTRGYDCDIEPSDVSYPYTPSIRATRSHTTLFVEFSSKADLARLGPWIAFAKSSTKDIRVILAVPGDGGLSFTDENAIRELGAGLYSVSEKQVVERVAPKDVSVNVSLPDLSTLHAKVRKMVGGVYEQFERSHWREGFEDACQIVEVEARRYLADGIRRTRIVILDNSGQPKNPTKARIDKMTLGALADTFSHVQNPNHADSQLATILKQVNKDRVGVVHHKKKASTESRLRKSVGKHMWVLLGALRLLKHVS